MPDNSGRPKIWTEELCLKALISYREHCDQLSVEPTKRGYKQWWEKQNSSVPSVQTIINYLGSWNRARLRAEGQASNGIKLHRRGEKRWTEQDCLNAITRYEKHCRQAKTNCTRDGYQEWQKPQIDAPSIGPIERLGSWNNMRQRAAKSQTTNASKLSL